MTGFANLAPSSATDGLGLRDNAPFPPHDSGSDWWRMPLARDVECLRLFLVNAFFLGEPLAADRSWVLVDTGASSTSSILEAAAKRFGPRSRPAAIILTHGHFDHVGGLPHLADEWQAPVYCHALELPYLTGQSSYPPPDPTVGGAMASLSRFYPRGPIQLGNRVRTLPQDGSVPGAPGWRWVSTPGHSPGHISLFRDSDRLLIAGDAFVTVAQEYASAILTQFPEVRRPPAYFTPDWYSARHSVEKLARLQPRLAATGHGVPMGGNELRQGLETLLRDWDEVAIPEGGRYSQESALANERGVIQVPPARIDTQLLMLAAFGAALGLYAIFSKRRA